MNTCSRIFLLAVAVFLAAGAAAQQGYPNRPIRLVVHTTAGASSDVTARVTADEMGKRLGQQFVVENRAGAGGLIGGHKQPDPRPALAIALPLRVGYELPLIIENLLPKADSAQGVAA